MSKNLNTDAISKEDIEAIKNAKSSMEHIGFAMQGLNSIGGAIETGINRIPEKQRLWLQQIVNKTLVALVKANLKTMQKGGNFKNPSNKSYKALVSATGAASGFFGSTTGVGTAIFASELALSTKFIMRSIMDIARSEGEDVYNMETQMACLQVFALGGTSASDDDLETSYYTTRIAMSTTLKGASSYISKNGIQGLSQVLVMSVNPFVKAIGIIASRFTIQVSEKFIAQSIPIIGAAGGGTINFMFINHFQKMAKAHFTLRRLERKYSEETIKNVYNKSTTNLK
jgi:hypothetical protein